MPIRNSPAFRRRRGTIGWEKTPRDPVIAAKFNTYRFADYKEAMIDLLGRLGSA